MLKDRHKSTLRTFVKSKWGIPIAVAVLYFIIGVIYISFFQFVWIDESYYYTHLMRISDCLRNGFWIGREPVGHHGFIFKMIPAFFFIIFDNYVVIPVIINITIACACFLLCYKLFTDHLRDHTLSLLLAAVILTNMMVIFTTYKYLLDINALFISLCIMVYLSAKERNVFVLSILLLLLLDAKAHVFFVILPGVCCYLFFTTVFSEKFASFGEVSKRVARFIVLSIILVAPSAVYSYGVLYTHILPYNRALSSILQFDTRHFDPAKAFRPERSTGIQLFDELPR